MDVIDGCSARFSDDAKAVNACREGARDSYLMSDMGRGAAVGSGQMEAYAVGYQATNTLCGGPYSNNQPFVTPPLRWW